MLKKIYGIMECHKINDTWPNYEEFYIGAESEHTYLVLETDTLEEETAYLIQTDEQDMSGHRMVFRFDLEIPKEFPKRWFVNKYLLTREDGGPEEGGWCWDCHDPLQSQLCPDEECAKLISKQMDSEIDHEGQEKEPYYNVNSPGHEYVKVENHPPMDPRRPHYE